MTRPCLRTALCLLAVMSCGGPPPPRPADRLPRQLGEAEFAQLMTDFSEPGGSYPYENFISNEISFQDVIPELLQHVAPGGAYVGVAPEQNFTYIAATRPAIAFIVDIRRQNLVEHLMYKALTELSPTRAEFVSRLFSREIAGTDSSTSALTLFDACIASTPDAARHAETLAALVECLTQRHALPLDGQDLDSLERVYGVFFRGGPLMDFTFASPEHPDSTFPGYAELMSTTDEDGVCRSWLADEESYRFVRDLQLKNLIVPLVGDFGGDKALRAVGRYVEEHGAVVATFYASNVEDHLADKWSAYTDNIRALPVDDTTRMIRFLVHGRRTLQGPIGDLPDAWPGRSY